MTSAEMFAVWYSEYPRHEARKDALKAWGQVNPDEEQFNALMDALRAQKRTLWADRQRQFIPLPATWLRGERWTDEVVTYQRPDPTGIPARAEFGLRMTPEDMALLESARRRT